MVIRGYNDDEVLDLLEFARARGLEIRFIEYMDVGGATQWDMRPGGLAGARSSRPSRARYGPVDPAPRGRLGAGRAVPAVRTAPRSGSSPRRRRRSAGPATARRLTADGTLLLCLYGERGLDLRELLRAGASDEEIADRIAETWSSRTDRGAEERAALADRGVLYQIESLRADPRREMHTRGG